MTRLIFLILIVQSSWLLAQSDSSQLADQNALKISELKSKINSALKTTTKEDTLKLQLKTVTERLATVEAQLDSLIKILTVIKEEKQPEPKDTEAYHIIVEAQANEESAKQALKTNKALFSDDLSIVKSKSGRWFFISLKAPLPPDQLQPKLREVRMKVPMAWYVKADEIQIEE